MNTVYRTDASDSFCFKFIDGVCTTVIEVLSSTFKRNINFNERFILWIAKCQDDSLKVICVVAFYGAWGTGKWYFGARTEDE